MSKIRIAYIAHPISGKIESNLADLRRIIRKLNLRHNDIIFSAPYYGDIMSLNDNEPSERARGIKNNLSLIHSGIFTELWLTGDIVSEGMKEEIFLFAKEGKPIFNFIGKL